MARHATDPVMMAVASHLEGKDGIKPHHMIAAVMRLQGAEPWQIASHLGFYERGEEEDINEVLETGMAHLPQAEVARILSIVHDPHAA